MSQNNSEGVRKPVLYGAVLLVVLVAGAVVFKQMSTPAPAPAPAAEAAEGTAKAGYSRPKPIHSVTGAGGADGEPMETTATPKEPRTARALSTAPAPVASPAVAASPEMRNLVSSLANLDLKTTPLTAEAAAAWKENLARLAQSGPAAVPAIQEFLALKQDVSFDTVPGAAGLLGASTLRLSLLDALGNMNTPEALALAAQSIQSTTDPREIGLLARNLERQAPEQYREAALAAARSAMAEASAGRLTGKDIGPLFDVMRDYGGANAVQDFEQAATGPWKYYATIALANLPDGAGVPALVQMITDPKSPAISSRVAALQALGQLAGDNAEARNVLLEQARQGNIASATWINVAASLGGDVLQIGNPQGNQNPNLRTWRLSYGNQSYYATPGPLTAEQVQQRIGVVDQFLALNNNNALAQTALQDARTKLLSRQPPR